MSKTSHTIWVCYDCAAMHANGELGDDSYTPDREPWNLLPDADIAAGLSDDEHECGIDPDLRGHVECDCEIRDFDTSRCDGCGTTLGGSRHAHAVFDDHRQEASYG